MSLHRICCCGGDTGGECGMTGRYTACVPGNQSEQLLIAFYPWRVANFSGQATGRLERSGPDFETEITVDERFGIHVAFGSRQITEQEVINEYGLGSFDSVVFGATSSVSDGSGGVAYSYRGFRARTQVLSGSPFFVLTPGGQLGSNYAAWQAASVPTLPSNCGVCNGNCTINFSIGRDEYQRTTSGDAESWTGQRVKTEIRDGREPAIETITASSTASVSRGIGDLPSNWDGPPGFNLCIPGSPFVVRPQPAAAPGNDAAIQAALQNDPLRTCRGCGG